MENTRALFANTINEIGSNANLSANECERFGMTWGCRDDCPVFERGKCDIQKENEDFFNRQPNAILSTPILTP